MMGRDDDVTMRETVPFTRVISMPVAVSRSVELTGGNFLSITFKMLNTSPSRSCAVTLRA